MWPPLLGAPFGVWLSRRRPRRPAGPRWWPAPSSRSGCYAGADDAIRHRAGGGNMANQIALGLGLGWLLLGSMVAPAAAHTMMQRPQVCPIDGTKWTATLDASGTSFGQQLDLKPIGPTPAPWRLAVCPTDHFVLFQQSFTPAEIATLRPLISSPAYQSLAKDHTEYFLLGKIFEQLGKPAFVTALAYVKASWQVDHDPVRYAEYAGEALRHYTAGLTRPELADAAASEAERQSLRLNAELIAGELERRLGRFETARARFARLEGSPQPKEEIHRAIIAQQLRLIAAGDSARHRIERPGDPREGDKRPTPPPTPPTAPPKTPPQTPDDPPIPPSPPPRPPRPQIPVT